jgi:hypothetical protein
MSVVDQGQATSRNGRHTGHRRRLELVGTPGEQNVTRSRTAVARFCGWESNPNGRSFEAYKIRRFVIRRNPRAFGVRIFAL